jgi:CBS domain-containing protein
MDDERDYYTRPEGSRRDDLAYGDRYLRGRRLGEERGRFDYSRGRFGERADYEYDEPRYGSERYYRDEQYRGSLHDRGEHFRRGFRDYAGHQRSRLRCHEIMTRDLAIASRDTTVKEVAIMMKEEDTGVIPVVDYDIPGGNGKTTADENVADSRNYNRGKLVGLITDRDIVTRGVAGEKEAIIAVRAEEIMSTDLYTAKPNDRVVDALRKMGDKQVRRIPVINDGGRLLGMISMADIARETEEDRELGQTLEEISQESSFWRRIFS